MHSSAEQPGDRAVSPWNHDGLTGTAGAQRHIRVADCTLRDGEQQPGVVLSTDAKVEIAEALASLGVHDLELGTPAVLPADADAIRRIVERDLGVYTSALARATEQDVDLVRACGVDAVRLSLPIGERQRRVKVRLDDDEYTARALRIASYAKEQGLEVIFSPYDTTRCDLAVLRSLLVAFRREGCVDRVRLVDTAGAASPEAIRFLVGQMHEASGGLPIEVHCHDDFGLATANTIAGALAGAAFVSTTVNGIGERSGNAALEEVVAALTLLYGIDLGISLDELTPLSRRVEELCGVTLQPHKPVVGRNSFAHESGLVVSGVLRDPFTAESYAPELVGQQRRIVVGKHSGRASVEAKVRDLLGSEAPGELDTDGLADDVKARALELGRSLEDDELLELVRTRAQGVMPMELDLIGLEHEAGVATLTIQRPKKLNAITLEMRQMILHALEQLHQDDDVRVIVIRGAGEQAFSAGGDIPQFAEYPPHELTELAYTVGAPERCRQPVIAAVDGLCFGGGFELALACDFRIATTRSQFGFPEITLGALPGSGGTQRAVRLIGLTRAKKLVLTGRGIDAETAEAWGLVSDVVEPSALDATVDELAQRLISLSPVALKFAKAVLNKALDGSFANGLEMEGKSMAILCGMEDFKEGVGAWKEKRPAVFRGR